MTHIYYYLQSRGKPHFEILIMWNFLSLIFFKKIRFNKMKESRDPVTRPLVFKSKQNEETCPFVRWRPLHTTVQAQKTIHLSVISWIWCFCATKVLLKRIGTFQFIFAYGFHIWVHFLGDDELMITTSAKIYLDFWLVFVSILLLP